MRRSADTTTRREFERFPMNMRACFSWTSADGKQRHASGIVQNLSARGAFITSRRCPWASSLTIVEIVVQTSGGTTCRMQLRGRVVRTELLSDESYGFAVLGDRQLSISKPPKPARRDDRKSSPVTHAAALNQPVAVKELVCAHPKLGGTH